MLFFHILSILTLFYWISMLINSTKGLSLLKALPKTTFGPHTQKLKQGPLVSIIVAAKEEEKSINNTVKHLLHQTYQNLEIIVVNDRSQDHTGKKLEELKQWSKDKKDIRVPLKVIHITSLPKGWLGKNHALYQGYLQAKGQYLLFTDADVMYRPHTLHDAVSYIQEHQVDHLTISPMMITKGFWLRSFVHLFLYSFNLFIQPWKGNDDSQTKEGIGIGAFNMISRKAYQEIGTHQSFAMRPDDDLQLGLKVKKSGLKQRMVIGIRHISVEWYPNLRSAIQGLEKNTFAGLNYQIWMVILAVLGQFFLLFFPFIAIWLFSGWISVIYLLCVGIMIGLYIAYIQKITLHIGYEVVALPLTVLLFIFTLLRSTYLTLKQGGVYWRGTFYSLSELKKLR